MPVMEYNSTDTGAPALTGQVGSLVAVLDAVLVNGYGSKPGAGWTKAFSGTNKAVYRMGAGNQFYLQVLDDAPGSGGAREARLRGGEGATNVDTLTNPFPTTTQLAAGVIVRKSDTLDAVARQWYIIADAATFYLCVKHSGGTDWKCSFGFGGFTSRVANDPGRTMVLGRTAENDSTTTSEVIGLASTLTGTTAGHFLARLHTGVVGSAAAGKHGDASLVNSDTRLTSTSAPLTGSNAADNFFWLSRIYFHTLSPTTIRGHLRGMLQFCHAAGALTDGAVIQGGAGGPFSGKQFRIRTPIFGGTTAAACAFEISDTWDAP